MGRQSAFWGVGKVVGQLYAVLYLAEAPVSLGDLAAALGVTKGNVSVAIRTLQQLGMCRRVVRPGDRRVFFEAEPDFWLIAQRVLERRQKPEFDTSFTLVRESLRVARQAGDWDDQRFAAERLQGLVQFYDELDAVVAALLALDPRRLRLAARLLARLGRQPAARTAGRRGR